MKKYLVSVAASMLLTVLLLPGSSASGSVVVDRIVAVVNGEIITLSDLQREEALRKNGPALNERQLLEDMIDRKLQLEAAKHAGLDVTDKELDEALADIKKRNSMDEDQFEAALAKEGLTLDQYRAELREQMTLSRMFSKYVRSGLSVDQAEVRAYYDRNSASFSLPEEVRIRQIYIPIPKNASAAEAAALKSRAEAAADRAKKGEDFLSLIHQYTPASSPLQDGDLGFMQRGHLLPEIQAAARDLKPGGVAGPILCSGGYHIIQLEDVRTPIKPFSKVKDEITQTLYQEKMENTYRTWLQSLRADANIENRL